ncbi:MAG: hypothetical protein RRA45_01560 [Saccharolobus sp.]|jgi:hypothetical protein|uniref:hypothetical protein n=1 Tax=Saccharolobus sp. TaxID=2100761 RepID=UPI0028CFBB11|nr:hypothetical protein [Saccharolobus sp.]MDT7860891.1 hypothetical protein [Saccharolobus sp.]
MLEYLYNSIIYADEFKKILTGKGIDSLEITGCYIAYIYDNLSIIGKNLCAGFLRMGLDVIFNITAKGKVLSPIYKLYIIPHFNSDGVCIGCNGGKVIVRISENGYNDPKDLLESKSLYPRVLINPEFKKKSMKIIEESVDVNNMRQKAKKEILSRMFFFSAGGSLHKFR